MFLKFCSTALFSFLWPVVGRSFNFNIFVQYGTQFVNFQSSGDPARHKASWNIFKLRVHAKYCQKTNIARFSSFFCFVFLHKKKVNKREQKDYIYNICKLIFINIYIYKVTFLHVVHEPRVLRPDDQASYDAAVVSHVCR